MVALFKTKIFLRVVLVILLISSPLGGKVLSSDPTKGKDVIKLNNILVDKITKEVRIKVKLALEEGILEYLLVHHQGKAYESVFKIIENKPSELNFALLLLGCKPMNFDRFMELTNKKEGFTELLKDHAENLVELKIYRDGKSVEWESLLKNREGSDISPIWVYTGGSFTKDNRYASDLELSHIGVWPDMSAVINLFSDMGNPYRGDFGLEMNRENKDLKVDQDFEIIIRRKK